MQFGDDDVLQDIDPSACHLKLGGKKGGLLFLLGQFYQSISPDVVA